MFFIPLKTMTDHLIGKKRIFKDFPKPQHLLNNPRNIPKCYRFSYSLNNFPKLPTLKHSNNFPNLKTPSITFPNITKA